MYKYQIAGEVQLKSVLILIQLEIIVPYCTVRTCRGSSSLHSQSFERTLLMNGCDLCMRAMLCTHSYSIVSTSSVQLAEIWNKAIWCSG